MTSKEKAKELFNIMSNQTYSYQEYAGAHYSICEIGYEAGKKCALIAVDEIIEAIDWHDYDFPNITMEYWQEVKKEIDEL